jgi:hypothetical protein
VPDGEAPSPFVDPDRAHGRDGIAGDAVIARLLRRSMLLARAPARPQDADVRASTANRTLWWIVGVMAVFGLLMLAGGDPGARDVLGGALALGLTVGVLGWLSYRYRVEPRRESFDAQARELGLRPEAGDPLGLLNVPFALFRWAASVREIENTARGTRGGSDVIVADYWFARSSDPSSDDYERYTCVLTPVTSGWADLAVVPERLASRIRSWAVPDILTESDAFNRRFEVRSADRRFALAFLDQRLMEWLLAQPLGVGLEILDGRLLTFRPRVTTSVDDVRRTLEAFDALLERIPRVVGSANPSIPPPPFERS